MRGCKAVVLFLAAAAAFGQNYLISNVAGRPPALGDVSPGDGVPTWQAIFEAPHQLAMDRAGNIYVADYLANTIRKISTDGIVTTVAGTGVYGYSGDGGPAKLAQLWEPAGVAIDASGNLYISDSRNARIRKVDTKGIISTSAGNGTQGYAGDGGPVSNAVLNTPWTLYFDSQGNLFFIDGPRVRKITPAGTISLFAGNGIEPPGTVPESTPIGDGGPATGALLNHPVALAFDSKGDVLIAEAVGERIRKVSPDGTISTLVNNICSPVGLAFDPAGNLFTANSYCLEVTKIAPDGTQTVIAGAMPPRAIPICDDPLGIDGPAGFAAPNGGAVLWDPAGRLLLGSYYGSLGGFIQSLTPANIFPAWVVNLASGCRSFHTPGELVSIRWLGMGPTTATAARPDANGLFPTQLVGTTVLFDGVPAPILYVDQSEIRTMIPFRVANQAGTVLQVIYQGVSSNSIYLDPHIASPALFTLSGGTGQAASLNQDLTPNSASNPAQKGSVVMLFGTGGGTFASPLNDGQVVQSAIPFTVPVHATLGGAPARVTYAGTAPGLVAGIMQVNVQIPPDTPSGNSSVVVSMPGVSSQKGVTIAVK